jgi:hypothetical protein
MLPLWGGSGDNPKAAHSQVGSQICGVLSQYWDYAEQKSAGVHWYELAWRSCKAIRIYLATYDPVAFSRTALDALRKKLLD